MTEQQQGLRGAFALPTESGENYWIEWALGKWREGDKDSVHTAYGQCRPDSKQAIVQSLLKTLKSAADDPNQSLKVPFIAMTLELIQATRDKSFVHRSFGSPTGFRFLFSALSPREARRH